MDCDLPSDVAITGMVLIMKRIRFYVGLTHDQTGDIIPLQERDRAIEAFGTKLTKWAGGYSLQYVSGDWVNEEGQSVAETSAVFEVLREVEAAGEFGLEAEVIKLARTIKHALDQQAVLYTIENVQGGFV